MKEYYWLDRLSPQIHIVWSGSMPPSWTEPPRRLYEHQLAVFTEGECLLRFEKESVSCKDGTFMIIPPGMLHSASALPNKGFSTCSIHFDWVFSQQSFSAKHCLYHPHRIPSEELHRPPSFIPKKLLWGKIELMEEVSDLLNKLAFRWKSTQAYYRSSCRALLLEILILLLSPSVKYQHGTRKADYLANETRRLLQTSFLNPISVQKTLNSLGYSYPHLARIFRKAYGITPLEYLNGLRLEHAKRLMNVLSCSIKEAALQSGFNDPHYFARIFRQYNGISPSGFMLKMHSSPKPESRKNRLI